MIPARAVAHQADALSINARILAAIEQASARTPYRLADFVSARGRSDLAAMHRFFRRSMEHDAFAPTYEMGAGAAEVLGAVEDLLAGTHPYIIARTPTHREYLRDLAELALALATSLRGFI